MTLDRTEGMTKLILDPQTERVLGVGIVGAGAGELIAEGVLAVEMAALAKDIALDHSSASHAFGDRHAISRSFLRHQHRHLPAQEELSPCGRERPARVTGRERRNTRS